MRLYRSNQVKNTIPSKFLFTRKNGLSFKAVAFEFYCLFRMIQKKKRRTLGFRLFFYQNPRTGAFMPSQPSHLMRAKIYSIALTKLQLDKMKQTQLIADQ